MSTIPRRKLLYGLSALTGIGSLSLATRVGLPSISDSDSDSDSSSGARGGEFDPAVDGFGFDNFSTPSEPPEPSALLSARDVREYLIASESSVVQPVEANAGFDRSIGAIADELHANANRLFGIRGFCFGIAMASQWYFEAPSAVPVEHDSVSEITDVDEPLEESSSPVRDDIERFHRSQFLYPETWAERWVLLRPEFIDYQQQASEIRSAIDTVGSAGVTISGSEVLDGHYLLLYDYDADDDSITFTAYDPNDDADEHAELDEPHTIGIDTTRGEPLMGTYEGEYDRFLFTDTDRSVRQNVEST
ncbi:hypothetical protein SAMN04487967_3478 [Natronorubrum sediminis]|uniref:Uncharacterized protein n=1 Tax=Natronorubrum sediminis TaxID=640943 RepID=A0A1H6G7S8_9EURY|nr:hypothetical protein [Natronorubrum sediminis]SEH17935.1 hypothetical protein SAMN04487967_3478 [Natronorubrum sediminis]